MVIFFRALICSKCMLLTQTIIWFQLCLLGPQACSYWASWGRYTISCIPANSTWLLPCLRFSKCLNTLVAWCQKAECSGTQDFKKASQDREVVSPKRYTLNFVKLLTPFSWCLVWKWPKSFGALSISHHRRDYKNSFLQAHKTHEFMHFYEQSSFGYQSPS